MTKAQTIPELLRKTVASFPFRMAFSEWNPGKKVWEGLTWKHFGEYIREWQEAFYSSGVRKGDRIAILLPNSIDAALCDLSVLCNGLIPVPLHAVDTPKSSAFIIQNSGAKILVVPKALRWNAIVSAGESFPDLKLVIVEDGDLTNTENSPVPVIGLKDWLKQRNPKEFVQEDVEPDDLAAIVYTSGTTGKPKGVMLTHAAITNNVADCDRILHISEHDVFLSFLPFSHTFERTVGYYLPTAKGGHVVFARSVLTIADDMQIHKPTIFVSVPRVYERFLSKFEEALSKAGPAAQFAANCAVELGWEQFCRENGLPVQSELVSPEARNMKLEELDKTFGVKVRSLFGGKLRFSISGGAALSKRVGEFFCSMRVPLLQGYGLTESCPVISVNTLGTNDPTTVGKALPSWEVRVGDNKELQVKGPSMMKGYWKRPDATKEAFTKDGWLRTGDQVEITERDHIRIKGRIKEIIVTSTGEKIAPADLEQAIVQDPLFEQVMVIGEGRPFITALAVVNAHEWEKFCEEQGIDPADDAAMQRRDIRMAALRRIKKKTANFPQYGVPRNVRLLREPWTVENSMLTVTMKIKRRTVEEKLKDEIESLYTTPQAR